MKPKTIALLGLLAVLLSFFAGCGPAYKLRKAKRLIAQAEMMGATWKTDTLFVEKIIHVPGPSTEVQIPVYRDTTIVKDKIITVIRYLKGLDGRIDTVKVFTKCPDQEVKDTVSRVINRTINAPKDARVAAWYRPAFWIVQGILLLILALIIRRIIK